MKYRYHIITIDGLKFLNLKSSRSFVLDLSDSDKTDYAAVKSTEFMNSNPLFDQILYVTKGDQKNEDALMHQIVKFDFYDLFHSDDFNVDNIKKELNKAVSSDRNAVFISHIFKEGFNIKFNKDSDESGEKFIPFEKSQSMAKSCKITFIKESLFKDLDERLSLGIDFKKISLIQSKYWAYRGLYLTDSERVNLDLNSKSVIVVDDDYHTPYVYKNKDGKKEHYPIFHIEDGNTKAEDKEHEFTVLQKSIKTNCFDGEGIISPKYADLINEQIKGEATSWQIRAPFTKGMLHCVDFKEFMKEYSKDANPKIKDCFGIERELNSAEIILTVSMFKCKAWLKTFWENHHKYHSDYHNDPMLFYFDKVEHYNHALYIVKENTEIEPDEDINALNYQFLDTLALSKDNFDKLVENHFSNGQKEIKNKYREEKADHEIDGRPACIRAALKNPLFYKEQAVKDALRQDLKNLRVDLGMGRIHTPGELRFLSGDLLSFMIMLLERSKDLSDAGDKDDIEKNINDLKKELIKADSFYMPKANKGIDMNPNYRYAVFRSPHLSRNEQVALKPSPQNPVYEKYFSHLKGVIMISRYSLTALALSGADMDGDMVKVFTDHIIKKAIIKGCYSDKGRKRVLPIVDIPSYKAKDSCPGDHISAELLLDTFSNNVGELSNLSVKFSQEEYKYKNIDNVKAGNGKDAYSYCPKFTAFTGIDIDSCKTGVKCTADIKKHRELAKGLSKDAAAFLNLKNELKTMYAQSASYKIEKIENGYRISLNNGKPIDLTAPDPGSLSILSLPYIFAEKCFEAKSTKSDNKVIEQILKPDNCPPYHFKFEGNSDWKNELEKDSEKIKKTEELLEAYKLVKIDVRNYSFNMKKLKDTNLYKKIINIILIKYDDYDSNLPLTEKSLCTEDVTVSYALTKSIELVSKCLDTEEKFKAALKTIHDENWQFIKLEDRKDFIDRLLGLADSEPAEDSVYALLCDFKNQGYKLLYYIVKHCYLLLLRSKAPEDYKNNKKSKSNDKQNDKPNYYDELFGILNRCFKGKSPKTEILDSINTKVYDILKGDICGGDELCALKYAWYLRINSDRNGTFLWNIIPDNVILENLEVCHA